MRVARLDDIGFQPTFHYDCPENQLRSLVGRVAGPVPKPTKDGLALLRPAARTLGRELPPTTANAYDEMPKRYTGAKRARYEAAAEKLSHKALTKKDATIKMFVKPERFDPHAKCDPDPRAIQFRAPKYAVVLGSYLHPIEHHLYHLSSASKGVPRTRNVAKGLNSVGRAELLKRKMAEFDDPAVISIDAKRFDKHVSFELLEIEHLVYLMSNPDPMFQQVLSWQLRNLCFSNLGMVYKLLGRRMSGDMNTAVGNCVLMLVMLIAFFLALSVEKWDCLDDGDDCLIIVERKSEAQVRAQLAPVFLSFGMEMKVEPTVYELFEVEFCRSKVVEYETGRYKFVRYYELVMSNALCGTRHWTSEKYRRKVLHAIGMCELIINLGVPVLQSFASAVLRNVPSEAVDLEVVSEGLFARTQRELRHLGMRAADVRPQTVQMCARESFSTAFGLSVMDQLALERRLDHWTFQTTGATHVGSEVDAHGWCVNQGFGEIYRQ